MNRAWLLLSFGDERQYAGNPGYLDEPRRVYRYDSFVQNHKQVSEGDIVLIRDKHRFQGVARIEKITETAGKKRKSRCPICGTSTIKARTSVKPRYRCKRDHAFEAPVVEMVSCRLYSAEYGNTFIFTPEALTLKELRTASPRPSDQLAIQEIEWTRIVPKILEKFPVVQTLLEAHSGQLTAEPTRACAFVMGETYTRKDIYEIVGVPDGLRGGDWDTGYHRHSNDYFLFVNIGLPGRTGHDYTNQFEGDRLVWYGKTGARLSHSSIQDLLEPGRSVYIFYRTKERQPFTYAGLGRPVRVDDIIPVRVVWAFDDIELLPPEQIPQEVNPAQVFVEGAVASVLVNVYERNAAAREACIDHWGCKCFVCGFDFEAVYGALGKGFTHVHHLKPLSEIGTSYQIDPVADLRPVCPNCHAIIHRTRPALEVKRLQLILSPK